MGNQGRQQFSNNPFPNFNQGWRQNNANFRGKQDRTLGSGGHQKQFPPLYERINKLEETCQQFIQIIPSESEEYRYIIE